MTVNDILGRVMSLLGYSNPDGTHSGLEVLKSRTVDCVNQILSDLSQSVRVSSLEDRLELTDSGLETVSYGLAMLLSLGIGDNEKNVLFSGLYNMKRAAYKSVVSTKSDVLPFDDGEV